MGRPDTGGSPANGCGAFSLAELYELAEGRLARDREAAYRDHLAVCPSCQEALEGVERLRRGVQADVEATALRAPADLAARVRREAVGARRATPPPQRAANPVPRAASPAPRAASPAPRAARPAPRWRSQRVVADAGLKWTLAAAALVIVGLVGLLVHFAGERRRQAPVVKRESPKTPEPSKSPDGTRVVVNPPERPPERGPDRPPEVPPERDPERPPEKPPVEKPPDPERPGPTVVVQAEPVPLDTCVGPLEVVHEDGKKENAAPGMKVAHTDVVATGSRPAAFTLRGGEELTMAANTRLKLEGREGRVLASLEGRGEVFVATGAGPQFAMALEGLEFSGEHVRFLARSAANRVDVAVYEGEVLRGAEAALKAGQGVAASKGAWGKPTPLHDPRPPAWVSSLAGALSMAFHEDFEKALPEGWLGDRVVNAKPLGRGGALGVIRMEDGYGLDTPVWERPIPYRKGMRVTLRYFANQDAPFEVMVMNRTAADNYGLVVERPAKGRWTTTSIDLDRTRPHEPGGRAWQGGDTIDALRVRGSEGGVKYELWIDDLTLWSPKP